MVKVTSSPSGLSCGLTRVQSLCSLSHPALSLVFLFSEQGYSSVFYQEVAEHPCALEFPWWEGGRPLSFCEQEASLGF